MKNIAEYVKIKSDFQYKNRKRGMKNMAQFPQILTANGSAFLLLLLLKLIMSRQAKIKTLTDVRLLSIMINMTMFQCVLDTLVFRIDGQMFPFARELNYIGNIVFYILNITISAIWPLFTEYKLNCSVEKVKKLGAVLGIPYLLTVIFVITTPFHGLIFTINEKNAYTRTGYNFLIPTIIILLFVLFGSIRVYLHCRSKGKYMIFPVMYFVIPIIIALAVQTFNYGVSLIFIGTAIGITGIYLSTQSESAYIDQLCGVYNRRYYIDYIRAFCNSKKKDETVTGVLIDMDNFKSINDNFGHETGDEALILFSSVLRRNMSEIGFVVRYGGDEFILITTGSEKDAENAVKGIAEELEALNASGRQKYKLEFSYGISAVNPDSSSDVFLDAMDSRMYEMKRARKAESKAAE